MKQIIGITILALTSHVAYAKSAARIPATMDKLKVECSAPKNFAGRTASVSGTVTLKPLESGAASAKGKLRFQLLDPKKVLDQDITIIGQFDDLTSVGSQRYLHGGGSVTNSDDVIQIYANFTEPDMSFVEYNGHRYKTSCK